MTGSSDKVSQSGVIDEGSYDHDLVFYTRKTLKPKPHKNNKILDRSLKYYTKENFKKKLSKVHSQTT